MHEKIEFDRSFVGTKLRQLRILQGLTQAEAASRAGVTITTLFRIERGFPVHLRSLKKLCAGLNTNFDDVRARRTTVLDEERAYVLHRTENSIWFAPEDRRRNIPNTTLQDLSDPQERARLGHLGLVPMFVSYPNLIMPDGPGTTVVELYGRYGSYLNADVYRDAIFYCQRGAVRLGIREESVELLAGDVVGHRTEDLQFLEPLNPLKLGDVPPLLIWMGGVRLGKIP